MPLRAPEAPARDEWTLIRNARQLLTLQGPGGPRFGPAMSELGVIPNGSVLIRNGVIQEVGPARRVENLAGARHAAEIDAAGNIVLPAFVDAATVLASAPATPEGEPQRTDTTNPRVSRKIVHARAAATALELARYGCLTVGARTAAASDMQNTMKVLRAHQVLQMRPLRIRSVLSPRLPADAERPHPDPDSRLDDLLVKWLLPVRNRKLSTVVEFDLADFDLAAVAAGARTAAGLGFTIRIRSPSPPGARVVQRALEAGAISVIAPSDPEPRLSALLATRGCLRVYPAREALEPSAGSAANMRQAISGGAAIAFCSDSGASDMFAGDRESGRAPLPDMQCLAGLAVHRLGLTIEEAITATVWNPACALRMVNVTGSLESGKAADLVILDSPDYRDLAPGTKRSDVSLVMRAGRAIFRSGVFIADDQTRSLIND